MSKNYKLLLGIILVAGIIGIAAVFLSSHTISVLQPKGTIANEQHKLIVLTSLLSLVIVVPVFALTFYIVWKYRASNTKATYAPDWDNNRAAETIWWLVPLALISVLAVITWVSSHKLDPYRPLDSSVRPLTIQVVALEWKWLFIYPEQNIATINYIRFPEKTPINFEITADAPMNSFWIPQLGGQVYAMAGMQTKLHLMADGIGTYKGSSANLSGPGFASMKFDVQSSTTTDFSSWVQSTKQQVRALDDAEYSALSKPSRNPTPSYYSSVDPGLYDTVMMKYMMPSQEKPAPARPAHQDTHHH